MAEEGRIGPLDSPKDQPTDALAAKGGISKTDSSDVKGQPKTKTDSGTTVDDKGGGPQKTDIEDTFFDPKDLDPSLVPAYKNMQRDYKKKMDQIAQGRHKIEAYDAFGADPLGNLQNMAKRLGYDLTKPGAELDKDNQGIPSNWEPQTWNEVLQKNTELTRKAVFDELMQKLEPIIGEVQSLRKSNLEKFLDDNCVDWREYEDDMKTNLQKHPSLVHDPAMLYRMSVPPEKLETQAFQKAMKKLESKMKGSEIGGKGSISSKGGDSEIPDRPMSFQESVEFAKKKLASEGILPPK